MVLVLAMRVASYWWVARLNPVHARVVNGVLLRVPTILSSTKSPSNNGRSVEVPLAVRPGPPGLNQNAISTPQVPHIAVRRACSGPAWDIADSSGAAGGRASAVGTTAIAITPMSTAMRQATRRFIDSSSSIGGAFFRTTLR
jgi:hypothetical protein